MSWGTRPIQYSILVCVAGSGHVATSTNHTSTSPWKVVTLAHEPFLETVACASSALCIAADINGNLLASTSPGGGAAAWTSTPVDAGDKQPLVQGSWKFTRLTDTHNALLGVTCVGTKFCVVVAHGGVGRAGRSGGPGARAGLALRRP